MKTPASRFALVVSAILVALAAHMVTTPPAPPAKPCRYECFVQRANAKREAAAFDEISRDTDLRPMNP